MTFAYADPPYLGCCALYGHEHGDDGRCWDSPLTHAALITRLMVEFPDGWALSLSSSSLRTMLNYCHQSARVAVWVKPFASFKPNVTPAYAWEPVIFMGGRRRTRTEWSGRDWVSAMPPVFSGEVDPKKGLPGMKPEAFCWWLLVDIFGAKKDDVLVDLFPGSGVVGRTWDKFRHYRGLLDTDGLPAAGEAPFVDAVRLSPDAESREP